MGQTTGVVGQLLSGWQVNALGIFHTGRSFTVVAIDQRGYNLSDKPKGVENYDLKLLVGDVAAVIRHLGREKAIIVGHDWGGIVAWHFAMTRPEMTDKLIVLNMPHPRGLWREMAHNPQQEFYRQWVRERLKTGAPRECSPGPMGSCTFQCQEGDYIYVERFYGGSCRNSPCFPVSASCGGVAVSCVGECQPWVGLGSEATKDVVPSGTAVCDGCRATSEDTVSDDDENGSCNGPWYGAVCRSVTPEEAAELEASGQGFVMRIPEK